MSFTEESSANVTTEAEEKVFGDYLAAHSKVCPLYLLLVPSIYVCKG